MDLQQRRRLADLYARGQELNLAPEGQEPFVVWVRKMTPSDAEVAYLKAGARRASTLAIAKEDPPSDLFLLLQGEVDRLTRENLVAWVSAQSVQEQRPLIEARLGGEDEWSEERYLISLQERAVDEDFLKRLDEDPDDKEVVRITGELQRFADTVTKEVDEFAKVAEQDAENLTDKELGGQVLDSMIKAHADAAWLTEFQRCQIWRCVFEGDDHSKRLFPTRTDVDDEQVEVLSLLQETIDKIHVGDVEGKESQPTPTSSPPSE